MLKRPSTIKLEGTLFFVVLVQQGPSLRAVAFAMTQCYINLDTDYIFLSTDNTYFFKKTFMNPE